MIIDPLYLIFLAPAMLLMGWAQHRIKSAYADGMQVRAPLSGAAAARHILDVSGLQDVPIEIAPGQLSDHYDPQQRVLRLSSDVYSTPSATAVGIAAHEAGHALQHATHYPPLVLRNLAVPAANLGPKLAMVLFIAGGAIATQGGTLGRTLIVAGLFSFGAVFAFQLINLPVEFNASNRAKRLLAEMGIVDETGASVVRRVLNAAGWTYVAGTLHSLLSVLYFIFIFFGRGRRG
jgi:uncharacterized protein